MYKTGCLVVLFFLFLSGPTPVHGEPPPLNLAQVIDEAAGNNSEILAARKRWEAFRERVPQSAALEDPMLGFGIINLPTNFSFDKEDMTMKEVSVFQKFPFPGKRDLMRDRAEKETEASLFDVEDKTNEIIRNVKYAYFDLSHVHRTTDVIQRNKRILEDFVKIAETRYALGEGIQQDVLKAHVEISKLVDEQIMLNQRRIALEAKLKSLLNRNHEEMLGRPENLVFEKIFLEVQTLQQDALTHSSALKKMKKMIEAREKEHLLAQREYFPDFGVRFSYGQRDDGDGIERRDLLSAMVEVNIPIFHKSKQRPKVAEALAEQQMAEAQFLTMKNEIFFMIADAAAMIQRLERQIELYRTGIIPQASLQLNSAMSAYKVNKVNFMTMLDSQMTVYSYELEYHQALTEYEKSIAGLEKIIGKRFSDRRKP